MRVVKVLNNSLVLALDENGAETILMGKGIGFHKAAGYEFKLDEVEKVFVLRDRQITRNIIKYHYQIVYDEESNDYGSLIFMVFRGFGVLYKIVANS